jgi:formylglycine-generating enzyme required for sulfatase activity
MARVIGRASVIAAIVTALLGILSAVSDAQPLSPDRERALKPMDRFKECENCPEMIVVPSGSFTMGSSASEPIRWGDESPQHSVTFAKAFAVGRFAVTFDEWDACVADGGCNGYRPFDQRWGRGKRPVINVSWNDAKTFVTWLSRKTGKTYRLLSESEREYVTRAGTTTPYWWGPSISMQQANYDGTFTFGPNGIGPRDESAQKTPPVVMTLPVDTFQPNPWGLYQVHGNVWEWTEDCYKDSYSGAPTDGSALISGDCSRRVLRGGSWVDFPFLLRSASRRANTLNRFFSIGFRLGRTLLAP